ncbi:hypothetical protein LCGC14_2234780 [marine sediment metagenome]|uniref:VTC domain-containing protein n=1 Tax=marine sediment metagenome TaxID=412755 RepID=A0A0F9D7E3_9ZZZZ
MPFHHTLQGSRFELKYLIDENCARVVRDFTACHLEPDEHALHRPNFEYPVHSLYLDTPDLALCRATLHGERNRFKLRIRFYDEDPAKPAFFEIKRRLDNVIIKRRAAVRGPSVQQILAGHLPAWSDLQEPGANNLGTLHRFCGLTGAIGAEGRIIVSYMREAYVTPNDNAVRVTFDRGLAVRRYRSGSPRGGDEPLVNVDLGRVILEIKFTDRFPFWLGEMVRTFNLQRCSMAKYVACLQELTRPGIPLGRSYRPGRVEVRL